MSRLLGFVGLFGVLALVVSPAHASREIQVPRDHATIQAAVNSAVPGDLILVLGGNYVELVEVKTEGLTIRALSGASLTGTFVVLANGVSIENWRITTSFHNQGLQTNNVSNVSVKNSTFLSSGNPNDYRGIWLNACRDCSIKNNEFLGHRFDGISIFDDCTGTEIKNNVARNNGGPGILTWAGSKGSLVANNEARNNVGCDIVDNSGGAHSFKNNRADCTSGF